MPQLGQQQLGEQLGVLHGSARMAGLVARHAHRLLVCALPLLALHAYVLLLLNPLMRIAFVNSYLKPADALQRGGYDFRMGEGFRIIPGPGYSFPVALSVAVIALEVIVLGLFFVAAHRRMMRWPSQTAAPWPWPVRVFAYIGLAAVLFAFGQVLMYALKPFAMQVNAGMARKMFPGSIPGPFIGLMQIALPLLGGWLLIRLGLVFLAIGLNDREFMARGLSEAITGDFWRTAGLICLAALVLVVVEVLPPVLEVMLFEPGAIPLGFHGVHIFAMSVFLLQFWLYLVISIALISVLYAHYRTSTAPRP